MNKYKPRFLTENEARQLIESYDENKYTKKMVKKNDFKTLQTNMLKMTSIYD